jgi:hypothetical protein
MASVAGLSVASVGGAVAGAIGAGGAAPAVMLLNRPQAGVLPTDEMVSLHAGAFVVEYGHPDPLGGVRWMQQ